MLRIGTSGWMYDHWREAFYPMGLRKRDWFGHYAAHFDTVEINNSFYRLPAAHTFAAWREQAPAGFVYAVKFSRFGTHMKKLQGSAETIPRFVSAAEQLGPTLGPILVHLPPNWRINLPRLEAFLGNAPPRHRWAVEVRDPSWLSEDLYRLLERHGAALCIHDNLPDHPWRLTAPFTYIRFHGGALGHYPREVLQPRADTIARWLADDVDVYAYFNNDWHAHALRDAGTLRELLAAYHRP